MKIILQLINGKTGSNIGANDRGLQYGDGFYTTTRVSQCVVECWPLHLQRLVFSAGQLGIEPIDWARLEEDVFRMATELRSGVIKIVITRGTGGRGYSPQGCDKPTVIITDFELPSHYATWQEQGINLGLGVLPLAISPALAGIKSLNRLEQVLGKREIERLGVDDALFCNGNGEVIESNAANLFWRSGEVVYTPELSLSGVDGVMRRWVMQWLTEQDINCEEVAVPPEVLLEADEIWLTNSLQHLVPVAKFVDRSFADFTMTRRIQQGFRDSCR